MSIKHEIGARLRQFGEGKFGSMAEFARALGIRPQNLNQYLNGLRVPGNRMKERLEELGCDPIWLITGMHKELLDHRYYESVKYQIRELMPEEFAMINFLNQIGITTRQELEDFLNPENVVKDVAMVMRERMEKYKIKKKK
jgi:transcriptional regulator with XRE-family HTH domain